MLDRECDVKVDLADEQSTKRAAAEILELYGQCDVFVHCAAAFNLAELKDLTAKTWRHVQTVNVESALWLAQAFTPGMAQRIRLHRVHRLRHVLEPPTSEFLPYIASKGALIGVMRSLARAFGPDGISVTAVAPGLTYTPAARALHPEEEFDIPSSARPSGGASSRVTRLLLSYSSPPTAGQPRLGRVHAADGGLVSGDSRPLRNPDPELPSVVDGFHATSTAQRAYELVRAFFDTINNIVAAYVCLSLAGGAH